MGKLLVPVTNIHVPVSPPVSPYTLKFQAVGDTKGLFYLLGRNFNTIPWENPHTATRVTVGGFDSSDSPNIEEGSAAGPVNRDNTDSNRTGNTSGTYWKFSLPSGQAIAVSRYTFRCRQPAQGTASNVANLTFEGSDDDSSYSVLDTRSGLTYAASESWQSLTVASPVSHRYHLIRHAGNVTGDNNFFFLSEIELYGVLTF